MISMGLGLMNFGRSHMAVIAARKDANEPCHARTASIVDLVYNMHTKQNPSRFEAAHSNKFEIWAPSNPMAFENKGQQNSKA